MDFEEAVEQLVDEYGCPENQAEDIKEFLIGAGNMYGIVELYEASGEDDIIDCDPDDWSDVLDLKA
jgi:hypothetical protein